MPPIPTRARCPLSPKATGEAAKPAATIIADTRQALLAAQSVHVVGSFTDAASTASVQQLDLRLGRGARGVAVATGSVTTTATAAGKTSTVKLALARVGNQLYIRGDRAYYARISAKAAAFAGRWISLSLSQDRYVADLTDINRLSAGLSGASSVSTLGVQSFGSGEAVVVRTGSGATLYVAATGTPRLLRLERPAASSVPQGSLDFSDYDAVLTVKAPAGAIAVATLRPAVPRASPTR